jgi:hypothetical protein
MHAFGSAVAFGLAALLLGPASALAAPPANDDFADAQLIGPGLPIVEGGTNVEATAESNEPSHGSFGPAQRSVWYQWTPSANIEVKVSTCADIGNGPFIAVYTGTEVDDLTPVADSDGACRFHFTATSGTNYKIATDFFGEGEFKLRLRPLAPPSNDDFANAQTVGPGIPINQAGTNVDADAEAGEPSHSSFGPGAQGSVWYQWTPSASIEAKVEVCNSDVTLPDPVVAVYTGTQIDDLTRIADSHFGFAAGCRLHFSASAGTTYKIAVDSFDGGTFPLNIRVLNPPSNDDFADAQTIGPGLPIVQPGSTVDGTAESGEPDHLGPSGDAHVSVWYQWTPSASVVAKVDTCDPGGSPVAAVYTGTQVDGLTPVAGSPDNCLFHFDALAGTTYKIAVDGFQESAFTLDLHELSPPANDDFADALAVGPGLPVSQGGSNVDATSEAGEPSHLGGGPGQANASVWYQWTPTADVEAKVKTCDSDPEPFQAGFAVYTGAAVNALTPVVDSSDFGPGCRAQFSAVADTTYRIAVDGSGEGSFTLDVHALDPPANDDFVDAQLLPPALPMSLAGTNVDATKETGEPNHLGSGPIPFNPKPSVWYAWTPSANVEAAVNVCENDNSGFAAVYTGASVNALTPVAQGQGCRPHFAALAGTTYRIAVDGFDEGAFTLDLHAYSPPANDAFVNALTIGPGLPVSQAGTTLDATREAFEPDPFGPFGPRAVATVWYRWTPATSGNVTLDTCQSGFDTVLAVYTGSRVVDLTKQAADDDGCDPPNDLGSKVTMSAVSGTAYSISVDTVVDAGGFTLAIQGPTPPASPPAPPASQAQPTGQPTGQRAAALKRCKKKKGAARKKCIKRAKRLPV